MKKQDLFHELKAEIDKTIALTNAIPDETFGISHNGKWSVAENLKHLVLSVKPVNLTMRLPQFLPKILFGKPKRNIMTYSDVVAAYQAKLAEGFKAPSAYVPPKSFPPKQQLIHEFTSIHQVMLKLAEQKNEDDLDAFLLPHPSIGKITLRELLCFTLYHIRHHLNTIEQSANVTS